MMIHELLIEKLGRQEAELVYNKSYDSYFSIVYNKPIFRKKDFCEALKINPKTMEKVLLNVICKDNFRDFHTINYHIYDLDKSKDSKIL